MRVDGIGQNDRTGCDRVNITFGDKIAAGGPELEDLYGIIKMLLPILESGPMVR